MATIKGLTIQINGDTVPLEKSLSGVNTKSRDLQSELKQVERLLKLDPKNTELLAQKQKLLAESVQTTKTRLDSLKSAEKQVQQQFSEGKVSEEQYRALRREIEKTEAQLKNTEQQANRTSAAFKSTGDKMTSAGKSLSTYVTAPIVAGIAMAGKAAMDSADQLTKLSDQTGLTTERLQELDYVGNQVGVGVETIAGAQAKLTKSMNAARDGTGEQAKAFKELGIRVTDSNGKLKSSEQIMLQAFDALSKVGNETERDALSMTIFGKSAMELNPVIKLGSDGLKELTQAARDTGAIMSGETVAQLDNFGDSLQALKTSAITTVAEALTPIIERVTAMLQWFTRLDEGTKSFILRVIMIVATVGPMLILMGKVAKGIGSIVDMTATLNPATLKTTAIILGVVAALIALLGIITVLSGKSGELERTFKNVGSSVSGIRGDVINAQRSLPAYADGTMYHRGGLAIVGERGPELVNLPRGSQVYPNGTAPAGAVYQQITVQVSANDLQQMAAVSRMFDDLTRAKNSGRVRI